VDGLTSSRTLTSSSQTTTDTFRYDVWGDIAERTRTTPTPHQFVGALGYEQEADSGLYFIGRRYYDPSLGRFISQDVAQWGANWYVYAANNPVSGFDYQGQWWKTALDIAGLILDIKDAIEDPSWDDILWIGGDIISIIAPTPTPSLIKHGGKLIGAGVKYGDNVVKFADDAADVGKRIDDVVKNPPHSIPAHGSDSNFPSDVRKQIDKLGENHGCHGCGSTDPGTKSGHFIPDHQPTSGLIGEGKPFPPGTPQVLAPHCKSCMKSQGGKVKRILDLLKKR
jgi:RHS repeat-associated protein